MTKTSTIIVCAAALALSACDKTVTNTQKDPLQDPSEMYMARVFHPFECKRMKVEEPIRRLYTREVNVWDGSETYKIMLVSEPKDRADKNSDYVANVYVRIDSVHVMNKIVAGIAANETQRQMAAQRTQQSVQRAAPRRSPLDDALGVIFGR